MAVETEIKYRLDAEQFELLEQDLAGINAKFISDELEENVIYGGEKLQEINSLLRIRTIDAETILTFKKRLPSNSAVKEQIEHETIVENADELRKIIEHLGFDKRVIYEKHRKTWEFRDVELVLDKLPFGFFMEIEGSKKAIDEAIVLLDLKRFEVEYKTYPRLTVEHGENIEGCFESRF